MKNPMTTKLLPGGVGLIAALITASATLYGCPNEGVVCSEGLTACGNQTCEDLQTDKRNCGGCGVACQLGQVCQSGACICAPGATDCNGACVVTNSNPQHCGSCGNACAAQEVCESGACKTSCSLGATQCGQSCVLLADDPNNCGACGAACDQGQSCHNGVCAYDLVAACFTNGQVRGIQAGTYLTGPLKAFGTGPQALDVYANELLLSADGTANRLYQGRLGDLTQLPPFNVIGAVANDVLVDGEFVYVTQSGSGTLTIFRGQGGAPDAGPMDAGTEDAGTPDAGEVDAGEPDAGETPDAGEELDAGEEMDAGEEVDAGSFKPNPDPIDAPAQFPNGVAFSVVREINFGANTFPQVMTKVGSRLFVTLYGGFDQSSLDAGQKVVEVDVTDPANAAVVGATDLAGLMYENFPMTGANVPRPQGITHRNGVLYVALNDLDVNYAVAGPGYLATVPLDGGAPGLVKLPEDKCLNAVWTATVGDKVLVSCAGKTDWVAGVTTQSGLAMVSATNEVVAAVSIGCPANDAGTCASPSLGRFGVVENSVYVGDQAAGRLFVFDISGNTLVEKRTYAAGQEPLNVCPVNQTTGYSNVGDVLAVP